VTCARCGHALGVAARFCGSCGQAVAQSARFGDGALGASLSEVLLFDKFTMGEIVRSPAFRFVFFLAMGPLALAHLDRVSFILWGIALYSGLLWAMLVYRLFAGRDLGFGWAVGTLFFTCFVMVPLLEFYLSRPPDYTKWLITRAAPHIQLVGYVFGVGLREELTKAVPLLLLAIVSARMRDPLTGLVLGFMSGIGFAVAENVLYVYKTVSHAASLSQASGAGIGDLVMPVYNNVIRMAMGPFVHGCLAGIFGYFIALAALDARRRGFLLIAGLSVASVLHGLYDTVVAYAPLVALLVHSFTYLLLMTYVLKARGLARAHEIGGGLFNRTVMGRASADFLAAAAAATPIPEDRALAATSVGRHLPPREHASAAVEGASGWRLRGTAGAATGRVVPLDAETRIGRDGRRCQVHLDEPTVSREHAMLTPGEAGTWRVLRLSRTSALFVNDQAVEEACLAPGDRLQLGGSAFVVEVG